MTDSVRVMVCDDDPLVREAYRAFFSHRDGYEVVREASDGAEAAEAYSVIQPDVVLMDLQMPGVSGVTATQRICERWPGAVIVVLTTFGSREFIVAALRAGAAGYLLKDCGPDALMEGIDQARRGEMPLSGAVRRQLVTELTESPAPPEASSDTGLTPREVELLNWLAHGLTNAQIGARMFVSEGSVKQYLTRITDKLGVKSRTQVLIRGIQLGLIDPYRVGQDA